MNTRTPQRALSLLLALILVWQMLPLSGFAAEVPQDAPLSDAEQVTDNPASEEANADTPDNQADDLSSQQEDSTLPAGENEEETLSPVDEDAETPADQPAEEISDESMPEAESRKASDDATAAAESSEIPSEEASPEDAAEEESLSEEDALALARTQALDEELGALLAAPQRTLAGSYASELAKFPASYQTALKTLHSKHPKWIFVAVNTGLDWNKVIAAETGTNSTMEYNYGPGNVASHLLLNNRDGFYNASSYSDTNHYRDVDGRFVSASRATVAYYMDPRNFLTDQYIFQFEAQTYSSSMTQAGVTAVLRSGRNDKYGMANRTTYIKTNGKEADLSSLSSNFGKTYPEIIYNLGILTKVSPYFVASKIVQETSADTTKSVISGTYSGYTGYYNFFNIGAYYHDGRSAIENGMRKAKSEGWSNPILALEGGVRFLADKYIYRGQDTIYYMRFNVSPNHKYDLYTHQYMSATAAAAGESRNTYAGYDKAGALESPFTFYIPVYKNMPDKTSVVSLTPSTKGKTTAKEILYSIPSATGTKLVTVPKGSAVTVVGGSVTSSEVYINRIYYPYWYKVKVAVSGKSYTGYIHHQSVSVNQVYHMKNGSTKSIASVTKVTGGYSGPIYYETSDPTVATVSATTGLIKAVGSGTCTIFAISGGGSFDAIGVKVSSSGAASSDKEGNGPSIGTPTNSSAASADGTVVLNAIAPRMECVALTWFPVNQADSYRVYRKTPGTSWEYIAEVADTRYLDYNVQSNTEYTYTVRARVNGSLLGYDHAGLTLLYLDTPLLSDATATGSGIRLSWYAVSGATGYRIYRKSGGSGWTLIQTVTSGKTTSWVDSSSLSSGVSYTYTVRALKDNSISYYDSYGVSALWLVEPLSTPVLSGAANQVDGVVLKWKAVSGAASYNVYRKSGSSAWKKIGVSKTVSYLDKEAVSGTQYTYTVRALRNGEISRYDPQGYSILFLSTPALTSAKPDIGGVVVQWKAVKGAKGYRVYRKISGGSWKAVEQVGAVTSYTDTSPLTPNTKYIYTVRALNGSAISGYVSAGIAATTPKAFGTPTLLAIANTVNGVAVKWGAVSGAKGYRVYRKVSGGKWQLIGTTTSVLYQDKTAVSGTNYTYTVRAISTSNTLSGYDKAGLSVLYLSTPTLHSTSTGSSGISIKWSAVAGAKGYRVYRRVANSKWALLKTVTSTSYIDRYSLVKGTIYIYTIRAVNGSAISSYNAGGISSTASISTKEVLVNYVTTGSLNYRTGAGTSATLAGTLSSGTTIQVVDGASVNVNGTAWHRFKLNGKYYYASSRYLKKA